MVEPLAESDDQPFADFINNVHKYVATASPLTNEWTERRRPSRVGPDFVRELKAGAGATSGFTGDRPGPALLAQGLVDELRLLVAPHVVGTGRRLFEDDAAYSLELVRLRAAPRRAAAPPPPPLARGSLLLHYDGGELRQPIVSRTRSDAGTCAPHPRVAQDEVVGAAGEAREAHAPAAVGDRDGRPVCAPLEHADRPVRIGQAGCAGPG